MPQGSVLSSVQGCRHRKVSSSSFITTNSEKKTHGFVYILIPIAGGGGEVDGVKGIKYVVIERNLTMGGEHAM